MTTGGDAGSTSRLGRLARQVYPHADRDYWRLSRGRYTRSAVRSLAPDVDRLRRAGTTRGRTPHLLVIPDTGPAHHNWHLAGGNLFFEAWQSAIERLGADRVSLLAVAAEESEADWHRRVLRALADEPITHVLIQPEEDPLHRTPWSWDVLAASLARSWDGSVVGYMYDSAYQWLELRARRLGRLLPHLLLADLSRPIAGLVRAGRYEVGPMTMPISDASVAAIDSHVAGVAKEFDVSFIGALYDYRVALLDRLRSNGLTVAVNPHRTVEAATYHESRSHMPSYLDFMAGLAGSETTINFSRAGGTPHEQYKIRMLEAALVRCLPLTDDVDMSRRFFAAKEYAHFADPAEIADVVAARLADRDLLRSDQEAAAERAHALARNDFWGRIDVGLRRRGLPILTGIDPPPPPA